jgi:hypothetical protein
MNVPAYPHPLSFREPDFRPELYYVISRGEEVGIFFRW